MLKPGVYRLQQHGFALPTILIASIVMLIVLMSAIQTVVVARLGVSDAYYNQLASEAAESGLTMAGDCIKADPSYSAAWSDTTSPKNGKLDTGEDCSGAAISGAPTTLLSQTSPAKLDVSYSVNYPNNAVNPVIVEATGTVQLKTKSGNAVWKTYTVNRKMSLSRGVKQATAFASGSGFSCAIFDGETWCFGSNAHADLGTGLCHSSDRGPSGSTPACPATTRDESLTPVKVMRASGVLEGKTDELVAVGNYAACTVSKDSGGQQTIYCWGSNNSGLLGRTTTGTTDLDGTLPAAVDMTNLSGKTITDIEMGRFRTCVVASGDVYCWGRGNFGALGRGSTTNSGTPVKVSTIGATASPSMPVSNVGTTPDLDSTCAVISQSSSTNAGRVYCWGRNHRGQLGDGTTTDRTSPVLLSGLTGASSVTGGGAFTQAGGYDYDVNSGGTALGTDSGTTTTAGRITRAHFCAVTIAKKLYCWGANQYGQLGIGLSISNGQSIAPNASRSRTPVAPDRPLYGMGGLTMNDSSVLVEQVATSYGSTCALLSAPTSVAGTIWCIGQNNYTLGRNGQRSSLEVPVNDTGTIIKNNFYPMTLPSGVTVQAIMGSINRMCFIASDRLYCAGNNAAGQLGIGNKTQYDIPMEAKVLRQFDTLQFY